ncbi:MAG: peptidoglycan editing factor PgeF [Ardenticatenaceae bacterium]|nr:peptidoglycan editing factor PgeF [Ardenticatenaceae bacterium]MCB9446138.1 peptidoglycan editing factor PgeF [Ardenticatenaceae bacterium]
MRQNQRNNIPYFQFESLPDNGRIQHAIFTRQGGVSPAPFESLNLSVSVPDEKARVYENRRRAYGLYGRDTDTVVHAHLIHDTAVARVTQANNGTWLPHVDAIITNEPGCALTMNYADCTPIFLYDPVHQAIGLGHAGWQGTVKDLPGAMVKAMQTEFGSKPADLIAGIGPSIGPCCYEVGEVVITAVHNAFDDPETLLLQPANQQTNNQQPAANNHRPHFDLPEANRRNLENAGVRHIELSGLCTACRTDLFFSHRAEKGRTGRFGTVFILA